MARLRPPAPAGPRPPRGLSARLGRWLRLLLLGLGLLGFGPLGEGLDPLLGEPLAAGPCAEDCDEGCDDAGCHGDRHHCGCCAPMPPAAPPPAWSLDEATEQAPGPALALLRPPERAPPLPWQPPRA